MEEVKSQPRQELGRRGSSKPHRSFREKIVDLAWYFLFLLIAFLIALLLR
jgi:hypothetical protein